MWTGVALGLTQGVRLLWYHSICRSDYTAAVALVLHCYTYIGAAYDRHCRKQFSALPLAILSVLAVHFLLAHGSKSSFVLAIALLVGMLGAAFSTTYSNPHSKFLEK